MSDKYDEYDDRCFFPMDDDSDYAQDKDVSSKSPNTSLDTARIIGLDPSKAKGKPPIFSHDDERQKYEPKPVILSKAPKQPNPCNEEARFRS